jgi:hypothetical protein
MLEKYDLIATYSDIYPYYCKYGNGEALKVFDGNLNFQEYTDDIFVKNIETDNFARMNKAICNFLWDKISIEDKIKLFEMIYEKQENVRIVAELGICASIRDVANKIFMSYDEKNNLLRRTLQWFIKDRLSEKPYYTDKSKWWIDMDKVREMGMFTHCDNTESFILIRLMFLQEIIDELKEIQDYD